MSSTIWPWSIALMQARRSCLTCVSKSLNTFSDKQFSFVPEQDFTQSCARADGDSVEAGGRVGYYTGAAAGVVMATGAAIGGAGSYVASKFTSSPSKEGGATGAPEDTGAGGMAPSDTPADERGYTGASGRAPSDAQPAGAPGLMLRCASGLS
jgi:hypothetical protein